ncbi:phosphonate C-P lyase system protein PhnH [Paenibacillus thalictri]|uniref:Phosphonate C-P lyase system protein PhnH n=1 Tax=Paenibacillus thalictri TaxID=2527873 RepID=A0A4V2J391_9BACL|nr:phosphonate C-P lyase system protein PhnH [Paenibacillus thalictri]TBL70524.1 phosphonate C-P lyase system protein PhnH [Paenibacillus thalictri]
MENVKHIVPAWDPVHDTQAVYRMLLEAISRPGTLVHIGPMIAKLPENMKCSPAAAGLAHALLDGEVRFAVRLEGQDVLPSYIRRMTFCRETALDEADYIFADGVMPEVDIEALLHAVKRGTLTAPDESATLFIRVQALCENESSCADECESPPSQVQPELSGAGIRADECESSPPQVQLELSGPGIRGTQFCCLSGVSPAWLKVREAINDEYPMGVDMYFFTESGELMALPRTTKLSKEGSSWLM